MPKPQTAKTTNATTNKNRVNQQKQLFNHNYWGRRRGRESERELNGNRSMGIKGPSKAANISVSLYIAGKKGRSQGELWGRGVGASGMPRYQPFGEHTQASRTVFPLGWSGLVPTYIKLSTTNENKPLNGVRGTGLRVYVCWLFVLRRACRIFHSILCSAQAQKANSTPFCHILWQHSKGCCWNLHGIENVRKFVAVWGSGRGS